ncbi:protein CASPARIAN STRIP INTEGRITY FACTOR 2-like isoform X1 [Cucurbita maxima]|uniref:Protein CASPARIAN STRIP INTEGRITY FACTOR 2-like isoform X1 n=2 Tax=Cucurbita TaxID=3660 RepID=A0A6J1L1I2_CUCMA|nr:protein CASPARIAN STRIP INTEGRITY FACTOR 2-like isoform X1 [Cucurbita moschata]XP_023006910.1 protein CASPARIAN STRIP INTEGRITY FACTOR 2-like isoform X1 [Cucurbita maxima]
MLLKYKLNFILVLLLVSASFLSTICSAVEGRADKPVHQGSNGRVVHEDGKKKMEEIIHERVLRVNTRDYGRYDPAPAFVKPPFKLIPN